MSGRCKSCFSKFRETIDERLRKGESPDKLSDWLRGQGEMIAAPSLLRHRKSHIPGMVGETNKTGLFIGENRNPPENTDYDPLNTTFIDLEASLKRIMDENVDSNIFTTVLEARKFTQLLMERIVQNQLLIVHELQKQYSDGKSGYPDSQIRGLKSLVEITNTLPTYTDKMILRKLADNNEEYFVDKIRKNAVETADTNADKYQDWDVLKNDFDITHPYDLINEYAEKLHPIHTDTCNEWQLKMNSYWNECFLQYMPTTYSSELQIKRYINHCLDRDHEHVSNEDFEKYRSIFVDRVVAKFEDPDNAVDDEHTLCLLIENVAQELQTIA